MTRMGSASQLGEVRRSSKGISNDRSSKGSILYSDYYDNETKKNINLVNQRSISLGALHKSGGTLEPRMAQLETLEAKMASIEVSLSTTPRRKKSSSAASTPVPQSLPISNGISYSPSNNKLKPITHLITSQPVNGVKEFEGLKTSYKEKEVEHSIKLNWPPKLRHVSAVNEKDNKLIKDKLVRLRSEIDSKKLAIKNIKIALDTIDISDNIDIRIQQAEFEYQLSREELNLLSLLEESKMLQASLEETIFLPLQTIFNYLRNSSVSLHGVEIMYDAKSPQFGAGQNEENMIFIEWAADGSGLCKGDRLLEVNGKIVIGKNKEDMFRLLTVSPSPAQVVVMRKQTQRPEQIMSHLQAELTVVKEKAGEAERTRDSFRSDNLRLTHRISYLEEQVAELLDRARENKSKPIAQVFQKGNHVALLANSSAIKCDKIKPRKVNIETQSTKSVDLLIEKPKRRERSQGRSTSSEVEAVAPVRKHRHNQDRSFEHLHGEQRQRHLREARSSLFNFMEKRNFKYASDFDSEPNFSVDSQTECNSESSLRYYKKNDKCRPIPPKKPIRLSLHRATSLMSVENEKKSLKRNYKGEAPPINQWASQII